MSFVLRRREAAHRLCLRRHLVHKEPSDRHRRLIIPKARHEHGPLTSAPPLPHRPPGRARPVGQAASSRHRCRQQVWAEMAARWLRISSFLGAQRAFPSAHVARRGCKVGQGMRQLCPALARAHGHPKSEIRPARPLRPRSARLNPAGDVAATCPAGGVAPHQTLRPW